MKEITCCFTGHRDVPQERKSEVKESLKRELSKLIDKGYRHFVAGGAIGFDTLAAQAVLDLKESNPDITLHLALPCHDQEKYWTPSQKLKYSEILERADSHEYVCEHYTRFCMAARNRRMVDLSSVVIAFFNGEKKGGTAMTVDYAAKKGIETINIY